uniref:Glycosyltransferase family 92 protein n=1 Tax=Globodera pallida TaxID=36090 RepID=A0A183BSQ3_GLOPA
MSDNPQQRRTKELNVCDDVWLSIFPFLGPAELAVVMALLSDRYDVLVDLHFRTRKWELGKLEVHRSEDGTGAQILKWNDDGSLSHLPMPQGPPPAKLVGFNRILISYIDGTVIAFLRHIRRLFNAGITLHLDIMDSEHRSWDIFVQEIWPLMSSNINRMSFYCSLDGLRNRISPTVLCDCANLRSIRSDFFAPQWPADDRREAAAGQAMTKWIHTPREDGLPKTIVLFGAMLPDNVVNELTETFLNASTAVNYIIVIEADVSADDEDDSAVYMPFEHQNGRTRERLAFRRHDDSAWLMERGPIVRDEKRWTEWKKAAMERIKKSLIGVFISDNYFGSLRQQTER